MRIELASRLRLAGWIVLAVASSGTALGGERFAPYVAADVQYNSNIFYLDDGESAIDDNGDARLDDMVHRYSAGFELKLPLGAQTLRAAFEGRRLEYDYFTGLDHNEYHAGAGLDWQLTTSLGGTLDFHQDHRMASFLDRDSTDLTLETESIGRAAFKLLVTPDWKVEGGLRSRELDSPLPDAPAFRLVEDAVDIAVKHAGKQLFSVGAYAKYLSGHYDGIADAGEFREWTAGLSAEYLIGALSHLDAELGFTQRDDAGGGDLGAITGKLAYHRDLTGKTSIELKVFQRVDSYVGGVSAIEDTGVGAALAWHATQKISVTGAYEWTSGRFYQSTPSSVDPDRKDDDQLASLILAYQMRPWLTLRAYGGYQSRHSNVELQSFDMALAGLELQARFD